MDKKRYLIKFTAAVGRQKKNIAEDDPGASMHKPVELTYFAIGVAENEEKLNDQIVLYGDPGFTTRVVEINELGDNVKGDDLAKLMPLSKAVQEV